MSVSSRSLYSSSSSSSSSVYNGSLNSLRLVGDSPALGEVRLLMERVAASTNASVLILGESGTGKELVARGIHDLSVRAGKPFVPVNCGAIPAELLESELFGHEKGAFTGALSRRLGRFELAQGGTLFLDEIGDMPMTMQVKLLRALQERSFERVGGSQTVAIDIRVIAATHRNIEEQIAQCLFREDLYYRLNVFPVTVPSLRQRKEDVPMLIRHFQAQLTERGVDCAAFSPAALAALQVYDWPGNVRELSNLVERMAIMHHDREVQLQDLPDRYVQNREVANLDEGEAVSTAALPPRVPELPMDGVDLKQYLTDIEVGLIQQALQRTQGVVARSAELLMLQRTTLVEKIKKYGISSEPS